MGVIEFHGVRYPGRHESLVTPETFQRVQEVFRSHHIHGNKPRVHNHYLAGTIFCACGPSVLRTDDELWASTLLSPQTGTNTGLAINNGGANIVFVVRADGQIQWGDGAAVRDTNLYRLAANNLASDDHLSLTTDGVATKVVAGAITDADFTVDENGSLGVDSADFPQVIEAISRTDRR